MDKPHEDADLTGFLRILENCHASQLPASERPGRLRELLFSELNTGFDIKTVRDLAEAVALENALFDEPFHHENILSAIAACIPVGQHLRKLSDKNWTEAAEIGKAYANEGEFPFSNARIKAVSDAGRRLKGRGYRLGVRGKQYELLDGGMEAAAGKIRSTFENVGPGIALDNLFNGLKTHYPFDFGLYLPHRRYAQGGEQRQPSIPYGYLINLAAGVQFPKVPPGDMSSEWVDSINLARDLVAT